MRNKTLKKDILVETSQSPRRIQDAPAAARSVEVEATGFPPLQPVARMRAEARSIGPDV